MEANTTTISIISIAKWLFPSLIGSLLAVWYKRNDIDWKSKTPLEKFLISFIALGAIIIGVVIASFDQLEDDTSVVRFSDLRKYLEFYKVGDLYLTTLQGNPKDILGYGTWVRYAEGRSLVGMSTQESSPTWTKFVDSIEGTYDNTITFPMEDWKPQSSEIRTSIQGRIVIGTGNTEKNEILESVTQPTADQIVTQTNIQPSIVIAIWKRTS